MAQCAAKTKAGKACQIPAQEGKKYCYVHQRQRTWRRILSISSISLAGALALGILSFLADVTGLLGFFGVNLPLSQPTEPATRTPPVLVTVSTTGKEIEIYFWAERDIINPGDCVTIKWDVEHVDKIYLEGGDFGKEGVGGHDSRRVCPTTTTTYALDVEADGESHSVRKTLALSTELPSGKIAFTSDREGQWRIFILDSTNKVTKVTNGANQDSLPVHDWDPSWSPDGKSIAFESGREGEFDIFTFSLVTNEMLRLTTDSAANLVPVWSPDGRYIAFQSTRSGNFDIYLMKPDGSNIQRLTNHAGPDTWPSWSPDGQRIVFESKRTENGNSGLYTMSVSGVEVKPLLVDGWNNGHPAWSRDGKIAFYSDRDGNKEIYTINEGGTDLKRITSDEAEDWFPAWSPDSKWIVFTSSRDGGLEIYITDSGGQHLLRVTNNQYQDRDPAWFSNN